MGQEEMFKKLPVLVYDETEGYRKANVADCFDDMVYPSINYDKSSKQFIVSYFKESEDDEDGYVDEYFVGETIEEAIRNAYNNFVKDGLIKIKEKKTMCSECAFSVDNCYCGLPGFTSRYPRYKSKGCSAFDKKAPKGYTLQSDGYFGWDKNGDDKNI